MNFLIKNQFFHIFLFVLIILPANIHSKTFDYNFIPKYLKLGQEGDSVQIVLKKYNVNFIKRNLNDYDYVIEVFLETNYDSIIIKKYELTVINSKVTMLECQFATNRNVDILEYLNKKANCVLNKSVKEDSKSLQESISLYIDYIRNHGDYISDNNYYMAQIEKLKQSVLSFSFDNVSISLLLKTTGKVNFMTITSTINDCTN